MPMQKIKNVLVVLVDWELAAVELVESATLRFQKKAHHEA